MTTLSEVLTKKVGKDKEGIWLGVLRELKFWF